MAQFARPVSDVTTDWATTPLWSKLDEATPDDGDFITGTSNAKTFEVALSAVTDPAIHTGHVARIRAKATGSGGGERLNTWGLYQGATAIATQNASITRGSFNEYSISLSEAQAGNITDYSDLRIRGLTSQGNGETIDVSWAELEVPDAQATQLTVQDATHSHSADAPSLTQHNVLAAQDGTHAHASDNIALIQHNILAVADASHALVSDNVVLTYNEPGVLLVIADGLHGHSIDSLVLTQHNVLVIQDAIHAHIGDNVVLNVGGEEGNTDMPGRKVGRHIAVWGLRT